MPNAIDLKGRKAVVTGGAQGIGQAIVARLLESGGELFIQTDVEERAELYAGVVASAAELVPAGDVAGSPVVAENPFAARSPREHRAIADGLPVHRMLWRRRG